MRRSFFVVLIVLFSIIAICVSVLYFVKFDGKLSNDLNDWALTGNYFAGTIGSIFGIISVILLIYTFDVQNSNINLQQFESTFFSLLNFQRQIVSSIVGEIKTNNDPSIVNAVGLEYIDILVTNLIDEHPLENIFSSDKLNTSEITNIRKGYYFYEGKIHTLDTYFRHLQQMLEYIDESNIVNKKKYVKIIQSQMSNNEIYLCFINSLSKYAKESFKDLLFRYDFFSYTINDKGFLDSIYKAFYNMNKAPISTKKNKLDILCSKMKSIIERKS